MYWIDIPVIMFLRIIYKNVFIQPEVNTFLRLTWIDIPIIMYWIALKLPLFLMQFDIYDHF